MVIKLILEIELIIGYHDDDHFQFFFSHFNETYFMHDYFTLPGQARMHCLLCNFKLSKRVSLFHVIWT